MMAKKSKEEQFWDSLKMPHDIVKSCKNCANTVKDYYGCDISESCYADHRRFQGDIAKPVYMDISDWIERSKQKYERISHQYENKKPPGAVPYDNYWVWRGEKDK